jgi:two-component system chemotaxis response regulator CheB
MPVPVVIAQHMPPHFTEALAKRLNETCEPHVKEAKAGDVLMPGCVYVAPGGQHLRMKPNGVSIDEDKGESPYKPSVDVLAESAREVYGKQVLAVMLTGMGSDGTKEFVKLKQTGAYVIAQDQLTSVVYGMPKAVLEAGGVNEVLPLEKIGMRVRSLLGV